MLIRCLETHAAGYLTPQRVALLADSNRMVPQLRAERRLDKQDRFERVHVCAVEQALEPPAYALARHAEHPMYLFAVRPAQNHVAGSARDELHPELMRFRQLPQFLQKLLVLFRDYHAASP